MLAGEAIKPSDKRHDWLGPGAYFWEADPHRALEFAQERVGVVPGGYEKAAVIGAVIDLGNCLDMSNRENVELFRAYHQSFLALQSLSGLPVPENENASNDPNKDRLLRYLDRAVFVHLHESIAEAAKGRKRKASTEMALEPFDTVRGVFTEGGRLYDGCGFHEHTHVQIAVRNIPECIIGLFKPLRL